VVLATVTALVTVAPSFWDALWPLAWGALLPLFLALREASPGRALLLGWWAETVMYWVGCYWLIGTLMRFGALSMPVSVLCFVVIGLGNGVRLGLFAWWLRWTARATSPWWVRLLLPACAYVTLDDLFPRVFPWYLGFLQFPAPLWMQIADVTGVHGLTFVLVLCSTVAVAWVPHPTQPGRTTRALMSVIVTGVLLLQGGYGLWRIRQVTAAMQHAPSLRLALIQPNIGIEEKRRDLAPDAQLDAQLALSGATLDQHPDLVIWPEGLYPFEVPAPLSQLPWPRLPQDQHAHWLIGALTSAGQGSARQVFNAALLLAPDGRILGHYAKQQ
jgi:apolipoprotein N-acyltransferase